MLRGAWQADGVMRIKHLEGAGDDRAKPRWRTTGQLWEIRGSETTEERQRRDRKQQEVSRGCQETEQITQAGEHSRKCLEKLGRNTRASEGKRRLQFLFFNYWRCLCKFWTICQFLPLGRSYAGVWWSSHLSKSWKGVEIWKEEEGELPFH